VGEDGHKVEEVYNIPSTDRWENKSSQQDFGATFEGLQSEASKTWDENMVYIQHSYNRAVHTSTGKSPFETCFGYFPPSPLDIAYGKQGGVREDLTGDALRAEFFIEKIRKIHIQVQETLQKSQEKYKARHDQHRKEKSFKVGDKVWLQVEQGEATGSW
jgi:hypothetical protein